MKPRTALHILIGVMLAVAIVFIASSLIAGSGSGLSQMIEAQRTNPILWLVDALALSVLGGLWFYALMLNHFQGYMESQSNLHVEQLNEMIERTNQVENANGEYADRVDRMELDMTRQRRDYSDQISTLEGAAEARHQVFEHETRQIAEHAYNAFQDRMIETSRQLETMAMSIQYQRGELKRMIQEIESLQSIVGVERRPAIEADSFNASEEAYLHQLSQKEASNVLENSVAPRLLESGAYPHSNEGDLEERLPGEELVARAPHAPASDWFGEYGLKPEIRKEAWKTRATERFQTGDFTEILPDAQRSVRTPAPISNLQQFRKPQGGTDSETVG